MGGGEVGDALKWMDGCMHGFGHGGWAWYGMVWYGIIYRG